ncbi:MULTISPECIES: hypothetical protein [Lactobacillaceae]|nr:MULTISPECIES: hypothetical protein [Lactobacillaceae]
MLEYIINIIMSLIDKYYPNIPPAIYVLILLLFGCIMCQRSKINKLNEELTKMQNDYDKLLKSVNTGGKLEISKINKDSVLHIKAENLSDGAIKEMLNSNNDNK